MRNSYPSQMTSVCCKTCGKQFLRPSSYVEFQRKKGKELKYCSRKCMGEGQRTNLSKELFEKNSIPVPASGCWIWTGPIWESNGYGRISRNRSSGGDIGAHKASYITHKGKVPIGHVVRHLCDTPLCVNPDHLLTGTVYDNKRDAVKRQRHAHGSTSGNAKLSENDIPLIRKLLASGLSQSEVARRFGVSHGIIFNIDHNVTWRHVP